MHARTRTIAWILVTIILSLIPAYVIGMSNENRLDELPFGYNLPFVLWGVFALILVVPVRRFIVGTIKIRSQSAWGSPMQIRDTVANAPQFVGRLDREKGLLETTARSIEQAEIRQSSWGNPNGVPYKVIRLRGDLLDQNGVVRESIPVEIRAKKDEWVGTILDGDRIRVEGQFKEDGILHTDKLYNFSSNSIVGNRK
ncbi:hypothetical protein ACFL0D_03540 [Thermoproteota archaeon]